MSGFYYSKCYKHFVLLLILYVRCGRLQFLVQVLQGSVWLMWMEMVSWKLLLLHLMGNLHNVYFTVCFIDL